jgi:excisionase family DNA binding protein
MSDQLEEQAESGLLRDVQLEFNRLVPQYNPKSGSVDIMFLAYLLKTSRFGLYQYGPITIDVSVVERAVERNVEHGDGSPVGYGDDVVRFSKLLMEEVRKSRRKRPDELHFLLAFMRCGEGVPGRVFSELGVTRRQVEDYANAERVGSTSQATGLERLYSPEETAEYLGVHVNTVRGWIKGGRLPARRLAGQRALRIRESDLLNVLEPVEPGELEGA